MLLETMSFFLSNFDIPRRIFREIFPINHDLLPSIIQQQRQSLDDDQQLEIEIDLRDTNPNDYNLAIIEEDPIIIVLKREFDNHNGDDDDSGDNKNKTRRIQVKTVGEFVVPKGVYDLKKLEAKVSKDNVLIITAPKIKKDIKKGRKIPIKTTSNGLKAKL